MVQTGKRGQPREVRTGYENNRWEQLMGGDQGAGEESFSMREERRARRSS